MRGTRATKMPRQISPNLLEVLSVRNGKPWNAGRSSRGASGVFPGGGPTMGSRGACTTRPSRRRRGEPAVQRRPRAGAEEPARVDDVQLRRAVDLDGALHPDVHARGRPDRGGDELVAGPAHDRPRQPDRARADPAQRAPGHEVRNPVSGPRARVVRDDRRERAGPAARARRVRVVRDPGVHRRRGGADLSRSSVCPCTRRSPSSSSGS